MLWHSLSGHSDFSRNEVTLKKKQSKSRGEKRRRAARRTRKRRPHQRLIGQHVRPIRGGVELDVGRRPLVREGRHAEFGNARLDLA